MHNAIEAAVGSLPLPGETASGDRHVAVEIPEGVVLAVIDGLGHGPEAAHAAERAAAVIEDRAMDEPLLALVRSCHAALGGTRGVVMNLASIDVSQKTMTWIGIGNVEGRLLLKTNDRGYAQQHMLLRPGVVGQRVPNLQTSATRIARGDVLIFATDGIDPDFANDLDIDAPAERIADTIVARHWKHTDDALVLVARYRG